GQTPAELTRFGIAAGIGETDNVKLSSSAPQSQTISAANVDFDVRRSGSRLDASALGNFTDLDYLQGAYSNQVLGRFDGIATAKLWSDRLKWTASDDYGEEEMDPFAAVIPTNLERVNVFATGPNLTLRPSDATFIDLDAQYSRITYQRSPFDSHDLTGSVEFGRQLSPLSSLSLVVKGAELRFDETTLNTNYDRREAYGRYRIQGARTSIEAQLGVTQANDIESWQTSPLVRLQLTRRISPFSVLTLFGGREYTDAGDSFSSLRPGAAGGIVVAPFSGTTGNYLRDYGSAGWQFERLRTTLGLTGTWEHDAYDGQSNLDTDREDLTLNLGRSLTPRLSAGVTGAIDRYEYLNEGFTDQFGTVGANLVYRPGRWLVISAEFEHSFRRTAGSSSLQFGATGYEENRAFIMVGYRPHADTSLGGRAGFGGMSAR
ncbi:MAG: hypothetical protein ACRET2_01765, partial [Steroidobacteraceae bacterium]